ncbi:hypothetical protein N665_0048s0041 [Sinapis alba]|nr:hypothetical protein N665_0048s0041 [Sinapis alba]
MIEDDMIIELKEHGMTNLDLPHNEALVIETILTTCEMTRSLIDTGSSVNMIYKDTLDKIELTDPKIRPSMHALTSFNGSSPNHIGTIIWLIYVGGVMLDTKFTIIDSPNMYNITFETLWIQAMRAVMLTNNQCIKFQQSEV